MKKIREFIKNHKHSIIEFLLTVLAVVCGIFLSLNFITISLQFADKSDKISASADVSPMRNFNVITPTNTSDEYTYVTFSSNDYPLGFYEFRIVYDFNPNIDHRFTAYQYLNNASISPESTIYGSSFVAYTNFNDSVGVSVPLRSNYSILFQLDRDDQTFSLYYRYLGTVNPSSVTVVDYNPNTSSLTCINDYTNYFISFGSPTDYNDFILVNGIIQDDHITFDLSSYSYRFPSTIYIIGSGTTPSLNVYYSVMTNYYVDSSSLIPTPTIYLDGSTIQCSYVNTSSYYYNLLVAVEYFQVNRDGDIYNTYTFNFGFPGDLSPYRFTPTHDGYYVARYVFRDRYSSLSNRLDYTIHYIRLDTPSLSFDGTRLIWSRIDNADYYVVFNVDNGNEVICSDNYYQPYTSGYYKVDARSYDDNYYASALSNQVYCPVYSTNPSMPSFAPLLDACNQFLELKLAPFLTVSSIVQVAFGLALLFIVIKLAVK